MHLPLTPTSKYESTDELLFKASQHPFLNPNWKLSHLWNKWTPSPPSSLNEEIAILAGWIIPQKLLEDLVSHIADANSLGLRETSFPKVFWGIYSTWKKIFILVKFLFHTNINGTATHWLPQSFPLLFNFNSITVPIGYGEWMDKQDRDPLTWPIGYAAAPHNHAIMVSSSVSLILLSSTQLKRWTQTDLCVYEYNVPLNLIKDGPYFPL